MRPDPKLITRYLKVPSKVPSVLNNTKVPSYHTKLLITVENPLERNITVMWSENVHNTLSHIGTTSPPLIPAKSS